MRKAATVNSVIERKDVSGRIEAPEQHAMFIGEFAFNAEGTLCAVARPFGKDVIGIDAKTFERTHVADTGGEPFEVALLRDNRVIARHLKTGELLRPE